MLGFGLAMKKFLTSELNWDHICLAAFGLQLLGQCAMIAGVKRNLISVDEDPEDELRDLLTYDCPITGKKRCPPCLQLGFQISI